MKKDIHPKYYDDAKITCACGNIVLAGSTKQDFKTELCSACHPFYTGKQKLVDTAGRVDKFQEKRAKAKAIKETASTRAPKKSRKKRTEKIASPTE